jgi:trimethylamine---corrinoid protein Co-methyltransferase
MPLHSISPSAPRFEVLTEEGIQRIHENILKVLWEVGVDFQHEEGLEIFKKAGAVVEGERVRIPPKMVMETVQLAPHEVTLFTRESEPAMQVGGYETHFGTYGTAPYAYDPYTGERRLATRQTIAEVARLCDYLPHLEWSMPMGVPSDVPVTVADRHQFYQAVTNQSKTLYSSTYTAAALEDVIEMAAVIAGGKENLRKKPFFTTGINPSSPLRYGHEVVGKLLVMAGAGLPIIYNSCPMTCGTAPGTMAATITMTVVEGLAGSILAQLKNPGVPVIPGGGPSTMDMLTTVVGLGTPELGLMVAGCAQMYRFYGIPSYGTAGATNSKVPDPQAAIEFTNSILTSALAGSNLVHCGGAVDSCMTVSMEAFVLCDEIIGMAQQIAKGVKVDDDTLAFDVIKKIGPGGHFLEEKHTLRHFREFHQSKMIDRQNYDGWIMSGGKTMNDLMTEKVDWVLKNYQPKPLPEDVMTELGKMMARFS